MEVFPDVGVSTPNTLALQCKKQTSSSAWALAESSFSQCPAQRTCSEILPWVPRAQSGEWHKNVAKSSYPSQVFFFFPLLVYKFSNNLYKVRIISIKASEKWLNTHNTEKILLILYIICNYHSHKDRIDCQLSNLPNYLPCNEMGSYGINKFCKGAVYLALKHLYNVGSS